MLVINMEITWNIEIILVYLQFSTVYVPSFISYMWSRLENLFQTLNSALFRGCFVLLLLFVC